MKKILSAFLCVMLLVGSVVPASALEGEASRAADTLSTLGLIDSTYDLSAPATRVQAVVLLVRLSGGEQAAAADNWIAGFRDVPAAAADAVNYAAHQGWVTGVTVLEFRPNQAITANAWAAFLLRMLGYSDKEGDFTVGGAAAFAQRIGLFSGSYSGSLTQGDLHRTAVDALSFFYRDGGATVAQHLVEQGAVSRTAANALELLNPALTARQIADRYSAAVFQLDTYDSQSGAEEGLVSGEASGFFISEDGLAVTNYHSIDGAVYATATLSTGEVYPVERVIYYDSSIDIAVICVSKEALEGQDTSAFACLELVGTEDICAGDTVYTLSSPLGLGLAVSSGIISATERDVERYALPCVMSTADISEGSSGGALLNVYGQVIAVTSGAYVYGNGMYLAVPVDPVLTADLTAEGLTLAEVVEAQANA